MKTGTVDFDFFDLDLYGVNKGPEMVKKARQAEAAERAEAAAAKRLDLDYMLATINQNAMREMETSAAQATVVAGPVPVKRKRRFDILPVLITSLEWAISAGVVVLAVIFVTGWCV